MPTKRPADSRPIAKLEAGLAHIEKRLSQNIEFADADTDAMAAANALLRVMVAQGEAILVVSRTQFAEGCAPNLRTMFEAWADLVLILGEGDRNENGRRFRLFGLLELRDYALAQRSPEDDFAAELAEIERQLSIYRHRHSALVTAIEDERKKKKSNFWSGKSRTAMLKAMDEKNRTKPTLMDTYKVFSWDSHNTVTGILDVTIDEDEGGQIRVNFRHRQTPEETGDFHCAMAESMLGDAWVKYKRAFGLDSRKGDRP